MGFPIKLLKSRTSIASRITDGQTRLLPRSCYSLPRAGRRLRLPPGGRMLKILGRKSSGNTQKVLWCCDELGLAYEREDYGRGFGNNHQPAYLALNPNGRVPTIVDDGFVLWESNTIVRYLCAKHGMGTLCPPELNHRIDLERWMDWQQTT